MLEVGRAEEAHLLLVGQHRDHDPAPGRRVPEDLGIAEVREAQVEHRVARVLRPGATAVAARGQVLGLPVVAMARIDGDEARRTGRTAKAARVGLVHHRAAREDHHPAFFAQGHLQVLPAQEVAAHGVAPAHVSPAVAEGVVLIEEVVLAVEKDEAVGVVHEVAGRGEVEAWPQRLGVGRGGTVRGRPRPEAESQSAGDEAQASHRPTRCRGCAGSARGTRPWFRAGRREP